MKEYLNQFAVITLACKENGEILERNIAAEKTTWLPKIGEYFTHWSHTSNLQEMLCQTHYLQPSDQQAKAIKFQIIPYNLDKSIIYLIFIFPESEFSKQKVGKEPFMKKMEYFFSAPKKIEYTEKQLIPFSECYSFFLNIFKDANFQSHIAFEDTIIYGSTSLFQRVFKELRHIIFLNTNTSVHFTVSATNNKDRNQIIIEIKLSNSFMKEEENKINISASKIQKELNYIQGTLKIDNFGIKTVILLILNTKEQNIRPLKVLIIDPHKKALRQMLEHVKMADPFAQTVAISDIDHALSISKKKFNIIILDPHISKFSFFPYFFKKFNYDLVAQITSNQEKNIIIFVVFHGKLIKEISSSHFNIVDYYNKPYRFSQTKMKIQHVIQTARKMNTLNQDLEKAQYFSQIDKLTGLFNRRYFDTYSERLLQEAIEKHFTFALLILDVDFFKNYNDLNGHSAGDLLLQEIAKILESTVRSTDMITRFGGEEFVILSPKAQENTGFLIAEKIRKKIEIYDFKNQKTQPNNNLTISIGVAIFSKDASNLTDLFNVADKNLYHAKKNGKNQTVTSRVKSNK